MSSIVETLAEAKTLQSAGRLRDAERLYRQILQLDASHAEAYRLLGAACHETGNLAEAAANLQQATRLNPDDVEAHHRLGVVLTHQGKLDEAIARFKRAAQLTPESAEISKNLRLTMAVRENMRGAELAQQWKIAEAVQCFRRAVDLKPDYGDAYYNLGGACARRSIRRGRGQLSTLARIGASPPTATTIWALPWSSCTGSTKRSRATGKHCNQARPCRRLQQLGGRAGQARKVRRSDCLPSAGRGVETRPCQHARQSGRGLGGTE